MPKMKHRKKQNRKPSNKRVDGTVVTHTPWIVVRGRLVPPPGRPQSITSLFKVVAEKIPFNCLNGVEADMKEQGLPLDGIYLAHDSMGAARYAGRGHIFSRLRSRQRKNPLQLLYFSFYVIENKNHEREVETLAIRAAGHLLDFNIRKKRPTIAPGSVRDYEPRTRFYERQLVKGKKTKTRRRYKRSMAK